MISTFQNQTQIQPRFKSRFFAKINHTVYSIAIEDISYFVFEDHVTIMTTNTKQRFVINQSIESLEAVLNPMNFFRINRRCIIHIASIKKMNLLSKSRIEIELSTGLKDIVSRSRTTPFRSWLDL